MKIVHHKNGNKFDNDICNLQVMTICANCKKEIPEEVTLPSGRTIYVALIPFIVDGKETYLCSDRCVKEYQEVKASEV